MKEKYPIQLYLSLFILAFLSSSCAILPGSWRPNRNGPAEGSPIPPTRANYLIEEKEKEDGMFIGLGLSGGGSRASNFAAAVMLELKSRGILDRIDFISSVSGGSLPAAYYALEGYKGIQFTRDEMAERMGRDFQNRWLLRWLLPQNIFRYWLTDFNRSDVMVQVFDGNLFHGATYADLNPKRPKLLINATDNGAVERFTFTDETFQRLGSDLKSYRIAAAVNVSSAFPGAFQSVTFENFNPPERGKRSFLHLYDGGPIDNLGVMALLDVLREGLGPATRRELFPKGCLIISVDASPRHIDDEAFRSDPRRFTDYFIDRNAIAAADVMLLSVRKDALETVGMNGTGPGGSPSIDIDTTGDFYIYRPENDCHFWHIALRHFQTGDPLGDRANRIETKFNIEPEEQKALFEAARALVSEGLDGKPGEWLGLTEAPARGSAAPFPSAAAPP